MKLEFLTSIKDYKLTEQQKIFGYFLKHKYNCNLFCESINVNPNKLKKVKPLDSLAMWRLTCQPFTPQEILG